MTTRATDDDFEIAVTRLTQKLRLLGATSLALNYTTLWLFAWGVTVLVLRATSPGIHLKVLLVGLAGIAAAMTIAVIKSSRHAPDPRAVRALLDRQNRCGGLLMAAANTELGRW